MVESIPLLSGADLDAPIAWRGGLPLSRRRYLADVAALAARLPPAGPVLAMTSDRYRFALSLGAALARGQFNLLPPNHAPDTMRRLRDEFRTAYLLAERPVPDARVAAAGIVPGAGDLADPVHAAQAVFGPSVTLFAPDDSAPVASNLPVPGIAPDQVVAHVLTSGSTGTSVPHPKAWELLVVNARAEARRMADFLARRSIAGLNLVGTVPAHHMYGFESTVLVAMLAGAAFAAERPFFPAEIVDSLRRLPSPRALVTTPFHLKTLLDSGLPVPRVDLIVCATAPLSPQLALRAEEALGGPLMEIYGCTEAGQVATRRTTSGSGWRTYDGLTVEASGAQAIVRGGHVPQPTPLADVIEVLDATHFELLGRSNDLINVAGKRGSLSHLNFHLNSIEGVRDGAFWLPDVGPVRHGEVEDVVRLVAFVVGSDVTRERLHAELRARIDPAFLPRRVVHVESLPRDPTGKLPAGRLEELGRQWLAATRATASRADDDAGR